MAVEIATAVVTVWPSGRGFGTKLNSEIAPQISAIGAAQGKQMGSIMSSTAGKAMAGLAAAAGVSKLLRGAVEEAREANKVAALTEAVIKSTGGAANVTAAGFAKLAESISMKTGIDDEQIQSAENLIARFTNIKNVVGENGAVFDRTTKLAVDMGVALRTDTASAAKILGKALDNPIKGAAALSRVGAGLTTQQIAMVKALTASGHQLDAQNLILDVVQKKYGGAAAAAGTASDRLKVAVGNLQEKIGGALVPILEKSATALTAMLTGFMALPGPVQTGIGVIVGLTAALSAVAAITNFVRTSTILKTAAEIASAVASKAMAVAQWALNAAMTANPIGLIVFALAALAAGLIYAYKHSQTFRDIVSSLGDVFRSVGAALFDFGKKVAEVIGNAVSFVRDHWQTMLAILTGPIGLAVKFVIDHFGSIVATVTGLPGRISAAARGMFDGVKNAFKAALNWIIAKWNNLAFSLPGVDVPGLGKVGGFTLNTPNIPLLAAGGTARSPGWAVVGEQGPELLSLSRGATVAPLPSAGMPPGTRGGYTHHGDINVVAPTSEATPREIIREQKKQAFLLGFV